MPNPFGLATAFAANAVTRAGYQVARLSREPGSKLFGNTVIDQVDPDPACHTVVLTYDDGPSPRNTPALLDLLAEHGVRATFFLIGDHVRKYPDIARRIAREGHIVGNHTQTHPNLALISPARVREELVACQQTIQDIIGVTPRLFRPPFGARRPDVMRTARAMRLTTLMWNASGKDWEPIGFNNMLSKAESEIRANQGRRRISNVLLHDASHLDGEELSSRENSIRVTAALLGRNDLQFTTLEFQRRLERIQPVRKIISRRVAA